MTFHRTAGKGGTRNSVRERHADRFLPNFNKSAGSGAKPRGRRVDNPGKGKPKKDTSGRYKRMMSGQAPRKNIGEHIGSRMIGRSKITGDW